jgi:PPOX class probable F420-dependent enzyme
MSSEKIALFEDQKYISLETYRKNGQAVKTPVWFVISDELIYVVTLESSWKVKRLKNNNDICISPSNFKGESKGPWVKGHAFFGSDSELELIMSLRNKKYGLLARLIGIFVSRLGKLAVIKIKI